MVKATKIKMVMHGDTVVYNADAFQLAEGSMLDALVEHLPGVELRDNGVITHNGRPVSELLVNGKDFFRGDPTVALDNLPAYMVDKVKVYERTTAYQQHFEPYSVNRPLVMDVNLKKEYSVGWIANAEAAYDSDHRYLGRVFALGFTPKTRTALFGNFNNTNDTRRREGFDDINAVNYTAGLTGHVDLPGGVGVDTDLTLYGRRGYDDNSLNTDDVVWNARISKSIMQGNLTFTVDAFDILGQLSNVRRAVNAQGWTETYYNVFPRYVMAHVIYKLNIEPKKNRK